MVKINTRTSEPIPLESGTVEEVQDFIYLGSNICTNGGADKDVELRISKAHHAFRTLHPVWRSSQLSINTKIRIFNTNVKPVILYGSETTQCLNNKLQVFINSRLRYILKVWWPNKISNKELWKKTIQEEISTTIKRRNGAGLATHSEKIKQIQPNKHWTITHKEREDMEGQKSTRHAAHYKILIKWGSPGKRPKL